MKKCATLTCLNEGSKSLLTLKFVEKSSGCSTFDIWLFEPAYDVLRVSTAGKYMYVIKKEEIMIYVHFWMK